MPGRPVHMKGDAVPGQPFAAMVGALNPSSSQPVLGMLIHQLEDLSDHLTSATLAGTVYIALTRLERAHPLDVTSMAGLEGGDALDTAALAYAAARRTLAEVLEMTAVVGSLPGTPLEDIIDSPEFERALCALRAEIASDAGMSDSGGMRVTLDNVAMDAYIALRTTVEAALDELKAKAKTP